MDLQKIKMLGSKVLVFVSNKQVDDLYSKEIVRADGTTAKLFLTVPAGDKDDRRHTIFVRTAKVVAKGRQARNVEVGDTAILSYELFNEDGKIVERTDDGVYYWLDSNTTYHTDDRWAYADRKYKRDNLVWRDGDIDTLSQLIGVIRDNVIIANDPYVFLEHGEVTVEKGAIIKYQERAKVIQRKVLASSFESTKKYGVEIGATVWAFESDTFNIELGDGKIVCCMNDSDVMLASLFQKL